LKQQQKSEEDEVALFQCAVGGVLFRALFPLFLPRFCHDSATVLPQFYRDSAAILLG